MATGCAGKHGEIGADTGESGGDTAAPVDVYAPAISQDSASLEEWEPALANDGANNLVSSWTEWPGGNANFPLGVSFSGDGGTTWSAPADIVSPDGSAADSVVEPLGTGFVLAWYDHNGAAPHIYAATGNAATGFGAPVEVSDPADDADYDKPWLTHLADGTALLTYQKVTGRKYAGIAATSSDGGRWTRSTMIEDTTFRNLYYPCASDAGRVYVTYYVEGAIGLGYSDDGGVTWTMNDSALGTPSNLSFAEPECVAQSEHVWVVYGNSTVDPDGDSTGVNPRLDQLFLADVAGDGTVTTTPIPLASYALAPQIALETSGAIDLTWYAGNDIGDPAGTFVRTQVLNDVVGEPVTWRTGVAFSPDRSADGWVGDYGGVRWIPDSDGTTGNLAATLVQTGADGYGHVSFVRASVP